MKATEAAKLLANRINQEHYVLHIMEKVFAAGVKHGHDLAKKVNADSDAQPSVCKCTNPVAFTRLLCPNCSDSVTKKKVKVKRQIKVNDTVQYSGSIFDVYLVKKDGTLNLFGEAGQKCGVNPIDVVLIEKTKIK